MNIDEKVRELIKDRVARIRTHRGKRIFMQDMFYPGRKKNQDLKDIEKRVSKLELIHSQIEEKVKKLKNLIPDITEQTPLCAVYLIYGKVLQTWESIFLLSKKGYNFNVMELIRSIGENLDLIKAFHLDKEGGYLKQWFQGEIIGHKTSREIESKFLKEGPLAKEIKAHDLSPYNLATDVYRAFSTYPHCAYAALLDCIDVFNEDFDWNIYAGSRWTLHNMHALKSAMTATLITLKMTYMELRDFDNYKEIDKILIDFAGPMDEKTLKDLIPKIK